jgi:predicted DNA-binding transcriptional regulator AlpA
MTDSINSKKKLLEHAIVDRMLNLDEVCRCIGNINRATLYRWSARGCFPCIRRFGGRSGVLLSELSLWLRTRPSIRGK